MSSLLGQHLQVGVTIAAICLGSLAVFGLLGHWLDQQFSTSPWLFVLMIFISFPISQIATYRWIKDHYLPKYQHPPSS